MVLLIQTPPEETEAIARRRSLQAVQSPDSFRKVASVIVILMISGFLTLVLVPWQQSIYGKGEVTVFNPMDRPQSIHALIDGRIQAWHVKEGDRVRKGDLLVQLQDIDPKFLDPRQLQRLKDQRQALLSRLAATENRIQAIQQQSQALAQAQGAAIPSAGVRVQQAGNRIQQAEQAVTAARQNLETARLNYDRLIELHRRGLRSTRDRELAEQAVVQAQTQLEQADAALNVALRDQSAAGFERSKVAADTEASLSSAYASLASARESLANTQSDLAKLEVEIAAMEQRIDQRSIEAPQDGIVVRITNVGPGQTVHPGDVLAMVAPETGDQAVALYVSHNDAPLVSEGRPVRLQFAGWPAIQFVGWPSVAVGTFAGRVAVIDAVNDQNTNRYRILVKPDYEAIRNGKEQPWPSSQYLRPGTEAAGWVMLDTVPLWFELWRQFNAFPPTVKTGPIAEMGRELEEGLKGRKKK